MKIKLFIFFFCFCFGLLNINSWADQQNKKFNLADPRYQITFPKDHGPHNNFAIEWWYLTANLKSDTLDDLGIQWTLFKSTLSPDSDKKSNQLNGFWMGHSAITTKNLHYFEERFARKESAQAGVTINPFKAWIDNWTITGDDEMKTILLETSGVKFSVYLKFSTEFSPVLQGEKGYSKKSQQGAASHYYSQPFYAVKGWVILKGKKHLVEGVGWLDREWSSNLLSKKQLGWNWFSMHLDNGQKIMLFKIRQNDSGDFLSGSWISKDGTTRTLNSNEIKLEETAYSTVKGRKIPTQWKISFLGKKNLVINTEALNSYSWMDTSFPYWEGPISFDGDFSGIGYLEMTGYNID